MERLRQAAFDPEAEFSIPLPLAYFPSRRLLLQERVEGMSAKEIFEHGDERQCAPGDLADLVRCIARLRNSPALCTELGRNASAACAERTWTHNAAKVIDRVEAMIKQNSTGPRRALAFGSMHAENWFFFVSYRGRREVEK